MTLNLWNIIILVGVIQGFIITLLLFNIKSNKSVNRLLAWIVLLISLASLNIFLLETVEGNYSVFWSILEVVFPMVIIMPIGPLIYFYVRSLLNPEFKFNYKDRLHFYPVLLDLIPNILALIYIIGVLIKIINPENAAIWGNYIEIYTMYVDIPRWISLAVYIKLTYNILKTYKFKEKNKIQFRWAKQFVLVFFIFLSVWLIHLLLYLIPSTSTILLNTVGWYPVYIPLIILIYWLGINGYLIGFKKLKKKSKNSFLTPEIIEETITSLKNVMNNDRLFLDTSLKLDHLVKKTGSSQKVISTVLNQHLGKSFNEYVNEFRIHEFKVRLLNPAYQHLTITAIAYECGFNSQATFQRTFKSITNQSPREFRQTHLKKND